MGAPTVPVGTTVTEIDQTSPTGSELPQITSVQPPQPTFPDGCGPKKNLAQENNCNNIGNFSFVGGVGTYSDPAKPKS